MTDAREIIALQEFAKWAIREGAFQAADLDGLSIQEKAHELGLIEATAYDPAGHNFPPPKPEQIETAFWALDAALAGAKP